MSWFPPSRPLPAEGGIATTRQRGAMAGTWWSARFVHVLESYGLGGRMQRGRRYARTGQVLDLSVQPGAIEARVQGSRPAPYRVTLSFRPPSEEQWERIERAMSAKVGFVAQLLAGEVPAELEELWEAAGVALFPRSWSQLRAQCSCPDWGDPCKHEAAVLYVFADQLDRDPWLVLAWRGRTRDELMRAFPSRGASPRLAPWWPFAAGPLPAFEQTGLEQTARIETTGDVLASMAPLDVSVRGVPLTELLGPAYDAARRGPPE